MYFFGGGAEDNRCLFNICVSRYCTACIKVSTISIEIESIKIGTRRGALISIYIKSPAALLPPLISSFSHASHCTLIPIISSKKPHRISIYHMSTLTSSFLWGRTSLLHHLMAKERYAIFRNRPAARRFRRPRVALRFSERVRKMYAHRLVVCAGDC